MTPVAARACCGALFSTGALPYASRGDAFRAARMGGTGRVTWRKAAAPKLCVVSLDCIFWVALYNDSNAVTALKTKATQRCSHVANSAYRHVDGCDHSSTEGWALAIFRTLAYLPAGRYTRMADARLIDGGSRYMDILAQRRYAQDMERYMHARCWLFW